MHIYLYLYVSTYWYIENYIGDLNETFRAVFKRKTYIKIIMFMYKSKNQYVLNHLEWESEELSLDLS